MPFPYKKHKFINKAPSLLNFPNEILKTNNHFKIDLLHNFYKGSKLSSYVNMITVYHIHQGGPCSLSVHWVYLPVSLSMSKGILEKY